MKIFIGETLEQGTVKESNFSSRNSSQIYIDL